VVVVYLDDILVSRNAADHLRDLKLVLTACKAGNWYLKRKVPLQRAVMNFWGTSCRASCRLIHKVRVLSDMRLNDVRVRSFWVLANFFRRDVHNHTRTCRRLHRLTKDGALGWGDAGNRV
jgi:hypothetical protein